MAEDRASAKLEEELKANFEQIGRKYYDESKAKSVQDTAYSEFFARIEQLRENRKNLETNKQMHQRKKRCENCQNIVLKESKFCSMCGQPLREIHPLQKRRGKQWGFGKAFY
jgi:NAD-dependent DNA ligase